MKFIMIESLLGLTVTRDIPSEVITGLMAGQYKLYGGVIRWAAGTENAGQIVRHLLPIGQTIEPLVQIDALAATTQQVLQIATGTMVMAGLNLAVTAVGFAVLNEKLKSLEGKLNELQKEVKAIRALLELEERARLAAALRDLLNVINVKNPDHRHTMLFNSKNVLAPISLKYKELLASGDTIEMAMAYEEYL
jgi:predicted nuclease with TOPRIM domain